MQREVERHRQVVKWEVPHSCVVYKNQEGYLRNEVSSPKPDHPVAQGSSSRKINPHNFWL